MKSGYVLLSRKFRSDSPFKVATKGSRRFSLGFKRFDKLYQDGPMKMSLKAIPFTMVFALFHYPAYGLEVVTICPLGKNGSHELRLLRGHWIDTSAIYYVSEDGRAPKRIYPGEENQSRGDSVRALCIGKKERVLLVTGEFSSNYLQGVAIRYNTQVQRTERIDFAERERPSAVDLSSREMLVVVPNTGRNESSRRYIIYRYVRGKGAHCDQTYSDGLTGSAITRIAVPSPNEQSESEENSMDALSNLYHDKLDAFGYWVNH
jgi:hypothetical protein